MNKTPERGPHHSDDTDGDNVTFVEFVAEMVPHDSPEFQERSRRTRAERGAPPLPPNDPTPDQTPPPAT